MPAARHLGDLFVPEPRSWGLRGDPYLWREMRDRFKSFPLPDSEAGLNRALETAFFEICGRPMSAPDRFHLEKFSHGGMSSGYIAPEFWRDAGLDLLLTRWRQAHVTDSKSDASR